MDIPPDFYSITTWPRPACPDISGGRDGGQTIILIVEWSRAKFFYWGLKLKSVK